MTSSPHTFDAASQKKLKQFFELGLKIAAGKTGIALLFAILHA